MPQSLGLQRVGKTERLNNNKNLLSGTQNSILDSVITYIGKESKMSGCMYMYH